ncbi:MAG TPA: flagellar export chaperone FlgN [Acidimicrobiia bacterium]|jgi:hypothetical protein
MSLSDVSNILWRERQLLELLLFKLEEEQMILASGRTRWLAHATREVETVLAEIKRLELERAVALESASAELGLTEAPTLKRLAQVVTGPWRRIFEDHRTALLELSHEIDTLAQTNRDLLGRGHQATREALRALGDSEPDVYSAHGVAASRTVNLGLVNEAM